MIVIEDYSASAGNVLTGQQKRDRLLLYVFAAIMLVAAIYNFVIATPRYSSDFSYVVRTATPSQDRYNFMNFSTSGEMVYNSEATIAYIRSRDLLQRINRDQLVSRMFATTGVDMFAAFPSVLAGRSQEELFKHFQRFITAEYDTKANISHVEVEAFSASDAYTLAERIRQAAEDKINAMNIRAQSGMTAAAEKEVAAAKADLALVLARLNAARDRSGVLDSQTQAMSAVKVASVSAGDLADINVELGQAMRTAPDSPAVAQLQARRQAVMSELARQNGAMAGGRNSLADRLRAYEEISPVRDAAEKRLLAASLALASARTSADRNRLYLEWVSRPVRSDEPLYPRHWQNMAITALLAIAALWIIRSLSELILESDG